MIRDVTINDAKRITEIYNYYIQNTIITFEEVLVTEDEMENRIRSANSNLPWILFEDNDNVLGYAYASEWKSRRAYKHSVESSIYLENSKSGKGIGTKLYLELIDRIVNNNLHAVIGGIALPNEASIALHEKLGFEKVAHFKEVGFKFGKWVDVGYWELVIK